MKKELAKAQHKKIAEAISSVWENKDYKLLRDVLSNNIEWFEGPFKEPLTSIDAVVKQWQADLINQKNTRVHTEVMAIDGSLGTYHFRASWEDDKGVHDLDGIFRVILSEKGKIKSFCQWWTEKS